MLSQESNHDFSEDESKFVLFLNLSCSMYDNSVLLGGSLAAKLFTFRAKIRLENLLRYL